MILGTTDGQIIIIDPVLRGKHTFQRYNYGFEKKKTVDLVRWLDKAPNSQYSSRFIAVFNDGMIAIYHQDRDVPQNSANVTPDQKEPKAYDADKDMLRLGDQTVSKLQVLKKMRGFIEEYSFEEQSYTKQSKKGSNNGSNQNQSAVMQVIKQATYNEWLQIKFKENITNRKHLNYVLT